ncbi:hypothetical protein BJ742DRAFT_775863 [Cladochytrium replicatum]|nr:hypothetical protein BJ742DRAFT_775863 [Cladochytrium replicatum]
MITAGLDGDWEGDTSQSRIFPGGARKKVKKPVVKQELREYQRRIYEWALKRNVIVVMDTGMGKTLIAIQLAKHYAAAAKVDQLQNKLSHKRKIVAFLVPTVPLVKQQTQYLDMYTQKTQLGPEVESRFGDMNPEDVKNEDWWKGIIHSRDVLCCTPQILYDAFHAAFLKLEHISLLVFDEAHNAVKSHPYSLIMQEYYHPSKEEGRPRILGLSASPINSSAESSASRRNLEDILDATLVTVIDEFRRPDMCLKFFNLSGWKGTTIPLLVALNNFEKELPSDCLVESKVLRSDEFIRTQVVHMAQSQKNMPMFSFSISDMTLKGDLDVMSFSPRVLSDLQKLSMRVPTISLDIDTGLSPKFKAMVEILDANVRTKRPLSAIVFVEMRSTAMLLCKLFAHPRVKPILPTVRCGTLVGHEGNRSYAMSSEQQTNILENFRANILNLIIATKVAAEGIDVPTCNLVIRYDLDRSTMNLVNFIQTRGRVRSDCGEFYIMCEQGNLEHERLWRGMQEEEIQIRRELLENTKQVIGTIDDPTDDDNKAPYHVFRRFEYTTQTGAQLQPSKAVSLLNEVVQCVHRDPYHENVVEYHFRKEEKMYTATAALPNSFPPQIRFMTGSGMPTKSLAKQSVAFELCKQLHTFSYLTDRLLPVKDRERRGGRDEEAVGKLKMLKSKSRRRMDYRINIPKKLQFGWNLSFERGTIVCLLLQLTSHSENLEAPSPMTIGLLGPREILSSETGLSLWPRKAELKIKINPIQCIISLDQFEEARRAHSVCLSPLLKNSLDANEIPGFLIVPMKLPEYTEVDWELVKDVIGITKNIPKDSVLTPEVTKWVVTDRALWNRKYVIENACAPRDETGIKLAGYMKGRLSREDRTQKYHHARWVCERTNLLAKGNVLDDRHDAVCLMSQNLEVYPVPAIIMMDCMKMPSIIYYLEMLCNAEELRLKQNLPIRADELIVAISSAAAALPFNNERLELLGDSFLKMTLARHLFVTCADKHEGILSMLMSLFQSNCTLWNKAKFRDIQEYVITKSLTRASWRPIHLDSVSESQTLSDKTIADVMESILGACFQAGGLVPATQAFRSIYLDSINDDFGKAAAQFKAQYVPSRNAHVGDQIVERIVGVHKVQKIIGYTFKDQLLLAEALTHQATASITSHHINDLNGLATPSLASFVCDINSSNTPNLKDASVNNSILACISVNLGLPRYMFHFSASLQEAISEYVVHLRVVQERQQGEGSNLYWHDVSPPKAISDIFEAVIGAVYLDSDFDLEEAWGVLDRIWVPWIDRYIKPHTVKCHPVRLLSHLMRIVACNNWTITTRNCRETGRFIAKFCVHKRDIALADGEHDKVARRNAAELAIKELIGTRFEGFEERTVLREAMNAWKEKHCICAGAAIKLGDGLASDVMETRKAAAKDLEDLGLFDETFF